MVRYLSLKAGDIVWQVKEPSYSGQPRPPIAKVVLEAEDGELFLVSLYGLKYFSNSHPPTDRRIFCDAVHLTKKMCRVELFATQRGARTATTHWVNFVRDERIRQLRDQISAVKRTGVLP